MIDSCTGVKQTTDCSSLCALPRANVRDVDDWCSDRKLLPLQLSSLFLQIYSQHLKKHTHTVSVW